MLFFSSFFVGALDYADDLVLLAPISTAMRKLLSICEEYAKDYSIKFNAKKSKWLAIISRIQSLAVVSTRLLSIPRGWL